MDKLIGVGIVALFVAAIVWTLKRPGGGQGRKR